MKKLKRFTCLTSAILLTIWILSGSVTTASEPVCVFLDNTDYKVVFGKPVLTAFPFTEEPHLKGPAGAVTIGIVLQTNHYEVFAYKPKENPPVLYRYLTTDFIEYSLPQPVLRLPEEQQWLGFRSLVKNPENNEYLVMAAEKIKVEKAGITNGIYFFKSTNGITFTSLDDGQAAYYDHDMGSLLWHPVKKQYAVWQITYQPYSLLSEYQDHLGPVRRVLSVRTSADGNQWTPSLAVRKKDPFQLHPNVYTPDEADSPDTQFYSAQPFPYANRFLAAVQIYAPSPQVVNPNQDITWPKRNPTSPKHGPQGFVEWWVADDPTAINTWKRPFRNSDLTTDTLNRLHHAPVIYNHKYIEIQGQQVFSIPLYRITGLNTKLNAIIETHSFIVPPKALALNATALWHPGKHPDYQRQAYIMAEVRGSDGQVIPGYEKEKCRIINQDSGNILLCWEGRTTAELRGQQIYLRFYFRDATLFSVEESQDQSDS